jgi:exo-1,4-beta-D-glucosaminidase
MLPEDRLWPINSWWDYHAGGGQFKNLNVFNNAMTAGYGAAASLEDYSRKAQVMAYDSHRAMFEAYGRNKYASTGVIQWMLNNAWPGLIWHLYDWYLRPGGGFFGTQRACEPIHLQYSYDDRSVVVVNDLQQPAIGLRVSAEVLDLELRSHFSKRAALDVAADGVSRAFVVPRPQGLRDSVYLVRLKLEDAAGETVSRNSYWLSRREDVLDWQKTQWYYTPTKTHGDLRALGTLPATTLALTSRVEENGREGRASIELRNDGKALACQVRVRLVDTASGEEVLPVYLDDNYFELVPGETRTIRAAFPLQGPVSRLAVEAEAWNAPAVRR